jgi:predicted ribosome quality control (RQC) complex YloA/Tae2 family protein
MSSSTETELILEQCLQTTSLCKKAIKHAQKKLDRQDAERIESQKFAWYREIGDSILAMPAAIVKGEAETIIENIHTHSLEHVALNPKLNAVENAQLLYKKARKGERSVEIAEEKVRATYDEIKRLENCIQECLQVKDSIEKLSSEDLRLRMNALTAAMEHLGIPCRSPIQPGQRKEIDETVPYRHYIFDETWHVYLGKTDVQNDELTVRFAKPWDIWMHVAQHAGSHVVIRRNKNGDWPPREILIKAASLAVWFSKAKHATSCEVHMTERRYVHKRRKSPAGEVVLQQFKSIRVAPASPQTYFPGKFEE